MSEPTKEELLARIAELGNVTLYYEQWLRLLDVQGTSVLSWKRTRAG